MIQVSNLVYEYPGKRALQGVSFNIEPATVTALVGPNGAGKTTLLRCMAALERPFAGTVVIDGLDTVEEPRQVHRRLGYLSDFFGLYDDLSVAQCLEYAAMAHGIASIDRAERVMTAAERLGLDDRLEVEAKALSRGLRQRLAVAQAIIHEPSVVLLDEPASGLDPEARTSLSTLLSELRGQGMTLVVSSHILSELEAYSTHMLTIRDGEITGHRALHEDEGEVMQIRLRAVSDLDRAQPILTEMGAKLLPDGGDEWLRFDLTGSEMERRILLKRLIDADVAVSEFAVERRSLEQVYLDEAGEVAE
ncbi:hypothetical protein BOW53_16020 [Solemya pervernicosa gill symbiont]|uniref:ABC transporter domain-containing protein n=2 Tax=Gammaproteobacteria incertae sedis TaxID=118884 RepID=A0A1T2KZM0_9GAMM|nr:ABC transporter ATP-binding protein [Candidatus Reidiella endopervernicosa]OOZ38297.1 hypothetical protein BOW53_16020 [Solemya pervernicosa gill symbiont]QKQ26006.1 ABC transporter ATP-binding protein [Candidatus Reidiella endopervernicosa]